MHEESTIIYEQTTEFIYLGQVVQLHGLQKKASGI